MSKLQIQEICDLLRRISREELNTRLDHCSHSFKADGSLLTELDLALNQSIQGSLAQSYPEIAFLSEEMSVEQQQQILDSGAAYWCLDPLDGTSNFVAGIPYYCISLALVENGSPSYGAVYDPVRDEMFSAAHGQGAWLNDEKLVPGNVDLKLHQCMAVVDLKRLSRAFKAAIVESPPFYSHRNFGASALEWCWLAAGRGHVYMHGGQKLWDHAAGFLILNEAGGQVQTIDGERVFNNTLESRSVVASLDPDLFRHWTDWVSSVLNND